MQFSFFIKTAEHEKIVNESISINQNLDTNNNLYRNIQMFHKIPIFIILPIFVTNHPDDIKPEDPSKSGEMWFDSVQ